jgi:hypothetical protein
MPTFFSINSSNFDNGLATVVGDVSAAGTAGFLLSTTYAYPAVTSTVADAIYGAAFQLSSLRGDLTGTVDIILSATNGSSTTASFPISGLTPNSGLSAIVPTNPVGWQLFAFPSPVTFPTGFFMRVGIKTSLLNKVTLIGAALTNLNRSYVTTRLANPAGGLADVIHIAGSLTPTELVPNTVTYNVTGPASYGNFYVHNGGVLNFDPSINIELTLSGAQGMQITPNGTVNIGTSDVPVNLNHVHKINLASSYINVHNGATLNVFGSYKTPYALLGANVATTDSYPLATDISNWIANNLNRQNGDNLLITPNGTTFGSFDSTRLKVKNSSNSITTWESCAFPHMSSNYIPSIVNLTRNVRFQGTNAAYGYIRFLDGSISNINNAEFAGFRNATYKGLQFCTNLSGYVSLSNCVFTGDGTANMPAFSFDASKSPVWDVFIRGCSFSGYGATTNIVTLAGLSANNFIFTDNIILSSSENGMLIDRLSSTYLDIENNFLIGNRQHGMVVSDVYVLSGTIGGIGCMNRACGSVVRSNNRIANFDGLAGHYNFADGINVLGTSNTLSSTAFRSLTANNNQSAGFELSGNVNDSMTPVRLNINGLTANYNRGAGFEGYSIAGNLDSMSFDSNQIGNMIISVGNADTLFSGLTSTNSINVSTKPFLGTVPYTVQPEDPFDNHADGSAYFGGVGTLSALDSNLVFPGDFTIEGWIESDGNTIDTNAKRIFSCGANVENGLQLILGTSNSVAANVLSVFTNSTLIIGDTQINDTGTTWYHFAVSRVNGTLRLFVDGVEQGTSVATNVNFNAGSTSPFVIGRYAGAATGRFAGRIANFRILNKTGLYSSNFDKPVAPFDVISNTALLFNGGGYANRTYFYAPASNIQILASKNYGTTLFRNSTMLGNQVNALTLDSTDFEQFSMDSCTLSSNTVDLACNASSDLIQGSYQFNNCTFGQGILSSTMQNYQPDVFNETGFVVMKQNGTPNMHYKWLRAGKLSLNAEFAFGDNTISEKLEPISDTIKLRSGPKLIPVNKNNSYTMSVHVRKSSNYAGAAPRLMLKRNAALGYEDMVLDFCTGPNEEWELLTGIVPAALDVGIFEVYVDCSGVGGSINIDNWSLTLN